MTCVYRFLDTEVVETCWELTKCGCGAGREVAVRPTNLRMQEQYVVWYHR